MTHKNIRKKITGSTSVKEENFSPSIALVFLFFVLLLFLAT
jgi:hypothetical protein